MTNISRYQEGMARELQAAGERFQTAQSEAERHPAAVDLLRLRLRYFAGRDEVWGEQARITDLCDLLTSDEVKSIIDYCWWSYRGGMETMKQHYDGMRAGGGGA